MAPIITWRGLTILDSGEGTYSNFKPGLTTRIMKPEPLAQALGEIAKDLGRGGANHSVTVTYLVEDADLEDLIDRIETITNTSGSGTLSVPGWKAIPACVIQEPQVETPERIELDPQPGTWTSSSPGWEITVTYNWRQLRRTA